MDKNKKKILIVITLTVLIVSLAFVLYGNLSRLIKLKSSIIDPITGNDCIEEVNIGEIEYENSLYHDCGDTSCPSGSGEFNGSQYDVDNVEEALSLLKTVSSAYCANGYKCVGKPDITPRDEEDSCITYSADNLALEDDLFDIVKNNVEDLNEISNIEDALSNYYKIYNSDFFCPHKYCEPETYEIILDQNGGTGGTEKVYEKIDTTYYLDEAETMEMTKKSNPIVKPTKSYAITYNDNNQGATFTPGPASLNAPFLGYFPNNCNYSYQPSYYESHHGPYGDYQIVDQYSSDLYNSDNEYCENNWANGASSLVDLDGYLDIYGYSDSGYDPNTSERINYQEYYGYPYNNKGKPVSYGYVVNFEFLYYYYVDHGYDPDKDPTYNDRYTNNKLNNVFYAQYDSTYLELPSITKDNYTCFWVDEDKGEDYNPDSISIPINKDTNLNAVCIPNNEITTIIKYCDSDGTNCVETDRQTYTYGFENYGDTIEVSPNNGSYLCPNSQNVTLDGNHTVTFYCTYDNYSNPFYGYNNDTNLGIEVDNGNSNAIITTPNTYYVAQCNFDSENNTWNSCDEPWKIKIWPAGQNGTGENEILNLSSGSPFNYSYFDNSSMSGYDATYRGKYGIYFINEYDPSDSSSSNNEPLEFRPYIEIKYKVDGQIYGSTQVKQPTNSITLLNAPSKDGYTFLVWQAYSETVNSIGMNGATSSSYTACTHSDHGDYNNDYIVYFNEGTYISEDQWNYSNGSYPCPTLDGYVNNVITVYLQAVYRKEPWVVIE